jgi:hypothetical protein
MKSIRADQQAFVYHCYHSLHTSCILSMAKELGPVLYMAEAEVKLWFK